MSLPMSFPVTMNQPEVKISDQIYYQRFRFGAENRQARKHRDGSFMKVKLLHIPPQSTMKIFCVQSGEMQHLPHPNTLNGPDCQDGIYCPNPFPTSVNQEISIPWLQINRTKKDDMTNMLQARSELLPHNSSDGCRIVQEDLKNGKKINSNQVCVCVHVAGTLSSGEQYQVQDFSTVIINEQRGTVLKIDELCLYATTVCGQVINHIFTTEDSPCIEPEMIEIYMEEKDERGHVIWTSEHFIAQKDDIRYKHVVNYPIPQYHNQSITEPVTVMLVMRCVRTQQEDRREFMYQPLPGVVYENRKRKVNLKEKYAHLDFPPSKVQKTAPAGAKVIQNLRQTLNGRSNTNPDVVADPTTVRSIPQMHGGSIGKKIPSAWEHGVQPAQSGLDPLLGDTSMVLDDLDPGTLAGNQTPESDLLAAAVRDSRVMETEVCCDTITEHGANASYPKPTQTLVRIPLHRDINQPRCLAYMPDSVETQTLSGQSTPNTDRTDVENMLPQTVLESQFEDEDTASDSIGSSSFPAPVVGKVVDKLAKMISYPKVYPRTCGGNQEQTAQPVVVSEQPTSYALPPQMGCGSQSTSVVPSEGSSVDPFPSVPGLQNGLGLHSQSGAGVQKDDAQYQNGSVSGFSLQMPQQNPVTSPLGTPSPDMSLPSFDILNLDSAALENLILDPEMSKNALSVFLDGNIKP